MTSSDRFAAGARIGDYVVEQELAYEVNAIVYLATHVVLPRQAHIKVTHPGSRSAAVQLLREACILEALSHAGIPRVHECGVLGDRRPWAAIEVMAGVTFERFSGDAPLALLDLVIALRDVADILRHAHERGVVHRRLIAATIVRTQRRRSGYAVCAWGDACTLDTAGGVTVDPRDDVGALGAIAFRALAGKPPEPGASVASVCPTAPGDLTALLEQMIAEPVARPVAAEVYERALWLSDALEAPLLERSRWTPPQGFVPDGVSAPSADGDRDGFAIRIGRGPTSNPS